MIHQRAATWLRYSYLATNFVRNFPSFFSNNRGWKSIPVVPDTDGQAGITMMVQSLWFKGIHCNPMLLNLVIGKSPTILFTAFHAKCVECILCWNIICQNICQNIMSDFQGQIAREWSWRNLTKIMQEQFEMINSTEKRYDIKLTHLGMISINVLTHLFITRGRKNLSHTDCQETRSYKFQT